MANETNQQDTQTHFGIGEECFDAVRGKVLPDLEAHLVVGAEELVPGEEGRGPTVVVSHPRRPEVKCWKMRIRRALANSASSTEALNSKSSSPGK